MEANCCVCGMPQELYKAIETEFDRRREELESGTPVPIIGIVCDKCKATT